MLSNVERENGRKMKRTSLVFSHVTVLVLLLIVLFVTMGFTEVKPVSPAVRADKPVTLSGYTQILGAVQKADVDSLTIRRSRFSLSANLLKNVKAKFSIDAVRTPILVDAMVDFTFSNAVNLRFGQFYVPFGIESTTSTADLDTINRAQPIDKLAPGRDIGTLGRDVGLTVFGTISIFDYNVGVFNGSGANKNDTNDEKDYAGRLGLKPFNFLSVGFSLYKGKYSPTVGDLPNRRDRTGVDGKLVLGEITVKSEYVWAYDRETNRRGWYVQAGWFLLPKKLQLVAKFDSYDKDVALASNRTNLYTAGLNYILSGKTKIQVNYESLRNELSETVNQALLVQFQTGF